jgi:hypothetical protein
MKGFVLKINKENIVGAIDEGITSIILTCNNDSCRVHFGSLDKSGMISHTWYTGNLQTDNCLTVYLEEITTVSEAKEIRDYNKSSIEDSMILYRQLKKELIEEGIINET